MSMVNMSEFIVHRLHLPHFVPLPIINGCRDLDNEMRFLFLRNDGSCEEWLFCDVITQKSVIPNQTSQELFAIAVFGSRIFLAGASGVIFEMSSLSRRLVCQTISNTSAIWDLHRASSSLYATCDIGLIQHYKIADEGGLQFIKSFDVQQCRQLFFTTNGNNIGVSGGIDRIFVWDLEKGKCKDIFQTESQSTSRLKEESRRHVSVWCGVLLSDGTLVTGDSSGATVFWDLNTGTPEASFKMHTSCVKSVSVSCVRGAETVFSAGVDPVIVSFRKESSSGDWCSSTILTRHSRTVHCLFELPSQLTREQGSVALLSTGEDAIFTIWFYENEYSPKVPFKRRSTKLAKGYQTIQSLPSFHQTASFYGEKVKVATTADNTLIVVPEGHEGLAVYRLGTCVNDMRSQPGPLPLLSSQQKLSEIHFDGKLLSFDFSRDSRWICYVTSSMSLRNKSKALRLLSVNFTLSQSIVPHELVHPTFMPAGSPGIEFHKVPVSIPVAGTTVQCVSFSSDSKHLVACTAENVLIHLLLMKPGTPECFELGKQGLKSMPAAVRVSPEFEETIYIAILAAADHAVTLYTLSFAESTTDKSLRTPMMVMKIPSLNKNSFVRSLTFHNFHFLLLYSNRQLLELTLDNSQHSDSGVMKPEFTAFTNHVDSLKWPVEFAHGVYPSQGVVDVRYLHDSSRHQDGIAKKLLCFNMLSVGLLDKESAQTFAESVRQNQDSLKPSKKLSKQYSSKTTLTKKANCFDLDDGIIAKNNGHSTDPSKSVNVRPFQLTKTFRYIADVIPLNRLESNSDLIVVEVTNDMLLESLPSGISKKQFGT